MLDYYNRDLDISAARAAEERILGKMVGAARTMIVERQNSLDFAQVIHDRMAGETPQGES